MISHKRIFHFVIYLKDEVRVKAPRATQLLCAYTHILKEATRYSQHITGLILEVVHRIFAQSRARYFVPCYNNQSRFHRRRRAIEPNFSSCSFKKLNLISDNFKKEQNIHNLFMQKDPKRRMS